MSFWHKIKTIDNKFSWSFLGFLIGILGFSVAIYTIYLKKVIKNKVVVFLW